MTLRVKIFIVTYDNNPKLNECLRSIQRSGALEPNHRYNVIDVTVVDNHSNVTVDGDVSSVVTNIIHNQARPDFSTGHLARSWNTGILHGFRSVTCPDTDVLILAQNDTVFAQGFLDYILDHLPAFDYITAGVGDEVQIMTVEAVKNIGMYDERFCNIGHHEADYFTRAKFHRSCHRSSINDYSHGRVWNPIHDPSRIVANDGHQPGSDRGDVHHMASLPHHHISFGVHQKKWGHFSFHTPEHPLPVPLPKMFMFYPYFERQLYDVEEKYEVF